MARRVFFSFHYKPDNWRAAQIRNIGNIEGNIPAKDNEWEDVSNGGDAAIKKWVNEQLMGRSCTIVLVGQHTAGRIWINYEIYSSWKKGMGVVGICVHNLLDYDQNKSKKGQNPFLKLRYKDKSLADIVKLYDPPYSESKKVYEYIKINISEWIDEAITIRDEQRKYFSKTINGGESVMANMGSEDDRPDDSDEEDIVEIDEQGRVYKPGESPLVVGKKTTILRDPKGEY